MDAIRDRDAAAFGRLLPTHADLQAAGFEGSGSRELAAHAAAAPAAFAKARRGPEADRPRRKWTSMLTPQPPGTLPAGAAGVAKDVVAYDNVVALVESQEGKRPGVSSARS